MITSSAFQAGASIQKVLLFKTSHSHVIPFAAGVETWHIAYDRRLFSSMVQNVLRFFLSFIISLLYMSI